REPIPDEFEEFTDEDEWIDKIEEQDEAKTYHTEKGDQDDDPYSTTLGLMLLLTTTLQYMLF
ncbi:16935_t:CDS:1, partial [Racocetra persica]